MLYFPFLHGLFCVYHVSVFHPWPLYLCINNFPLSLSLKMFTEICPCVPLSVTMKDNLLQFSFLQILPVWLIDYIKVLRYINTKRVIQAKTGESTRWWWWYHRAHQKKMSWFYSRRTALSNNCTVWVCFTPWTWSCWSSLGTLESGCIYVFSSHEICRLSFAATMDVSMVSLCSKVMCVHSYCMYWCGLRIISCC